MRAVYEGIALGHRENIESLRSCGFINPRARFTGGAANSKVWCRIFADVLGLEVETLKSKQTGALGAAIAAGTAVGVFRDYKDAAAKVVKIENSYIPNEKNTGVYNDKFERFKKALNMLESI